MAVLRPDIDAIQRLKRERNAIILAHNYQTPEIFHGVADIVGDSLALAREAVKVEADVIVLAGVHFMAETAKLLNPSRTVLIPDSAAGCSLASSITAADVRLLRETYPGVPIVAYVNTSAEVKAECDICCTSGNARKVVESLGAPRVIMLPDRYLARNIAAETDIEIIAWGGEGACEVHERFTPADIATLRQTYPGALVLAHPECPREVVEAADFAGSTAAMADFVGSRRPARGGARHRMLDGRQSRRPASGRRVREAVQSLPAYEADPLPKIRRALETMSTEVFVAAEDVAARARRAVERMIAIG